MAKKPNPLDDPPTASSSSDTDLSSSSSESSPLVTIAIPGKPSPSPGSETETDSDSSPSTRSDKSIAIAITNLKKTTQPLTLALPATTNKKRPRQQQSEPSSSKRAFQRLWSEEDEIALLQGMIDFKTNTGKIPYEDTNGFYEFMKKSISVEVSKSQFMDKIRSLKKKYTGKGKNGNDVVFSKAHDLKSLGLSKFIWGPDGMGMESAKSNGVSKKVKKVVDAVKVELFSNGVEEEEVVVVEEKGWFEESFLVGKIVGFGVDEGYVKGKWKEVSVEGKKKVEERMKSLRSKEIEYVLEKTKFLHEVTAMIAEVLSKQ